MIISVNKTMKSNWNIYTIVGIIFFVFSILLIIGGSIIGVIGMLSSAFCLYKGYKRGKCQ
jgi:hypothetical protein